MDKKYFLIIGNGRTGFTLLLSYLDSLEDVNANGELKIPRPDTTENSNSSAPTLKFLKNF